MLIVTTDAVAGRTVVETFGLVRGSTVRSKHVGTDILATLRNVVGGEQTGYTSLLASAREQALDRVISDAEAMGANAIVGFRLETSSVMAGASEIMAYGTAVRVE
ncbi:MAG: YbjQ family protein [Pseudomonadota bacterium]